MRFLIIIFLLSVSGDLTAQTSGVKKVKAFALAYEPTPVEGKRVTLETIPTSISDEFRALRKNNQKYEEHLVLIFAKVLRYHLDCCHQSYELRIKNTQSITSEDPLVFELMTLTDRYTIDTPVELLTSAVVLEILAEKPELLNYEPLRKEFQKISEIRKKIEEGQ